MLPTQLGTRLGPFQSDISRGQPRGRSGPGVGADPSSPPRRWAYLTGCPGLSSSSSLSALLNEACPALTDLGLACPLPAPPPAEPSLSNFGLPARLAPSPAPPQGPPGPGPLLPSPVGRSNPIAEAQTRPCSPARLLSSPGRLRPYPTGLHQPGTWGSVSPVGPKPVSNRQTAAAQPNPPAPPPPPRPGAGAPANSTITPTTKGGLCARRSANPPEKGGPVSALSPTRTSLGPDRRVPRPIRRGKP